MLGFQNHKAIPLARPTAMLLLSCLTLLSSCAADAPEQNSGVQPARQNHSSDGKGLIPCGQQALSLINPSGLDLNQLFTTTNQGQRESICQTLARKRQRVGIFQIAGVYCATCQEQAAYISQQNLTNVAHIIVFTDDRASLDPQEELNFFHRTTQRPYRFDAGLTLFRALSPGKADLFGTTLVASVTGEYRVFVEEKREQQWVAAAQELHNRAP